MSKTEKPWLVTFRGKRGGTLRRRFSTRWTAVEFMETALHFVHPSDKTLDGPQNAAH